MTATTDPGTATTAVFALVGDLTPHLVETVEGLVAAPVGAAGPVTVLDLSAVGSCDRGGLAALTDMTDRLAGRGHQVYLAGPPALVMMAYYLSERRPEVALYDDVGSAVSGDHDGLIDVYAQCGL